MSMFNKDCICLECKTKEESRSDYKDALEAVRQNERQGNFDFEGIGFKKQQEG